MKDRKTKQPTRRGVQRSERFEPPHGQPRRQGQVDLWPLQQGVSQQGVLWLPWKQFKSNHCGIVLFSRWAWGPTWSWCISWDDSTLALTVGKFSIPASKYDLGVNSPQETIREYTKHVSQSTVAFFVELVVKELQFQSRTLRIEGKCQKDLKM